MSASPARPNPSEQLLPPVTRTRALLTGLAAGPLVTAGWGFAAAGIGQLGAGGGLASWLFLGLGVLTLAAGLVLSVWLLRGRHRGTRIGILAATLAGLPLAPLAQPILTSTILTFANAAESGVPDPLLVYAVGWLLLAAPGLVTGPAAWWWVAHLNRPRP